MAKTRVSPIMTSDTTPSPYVITKSRAMYSSQAWYLFNNSTKDNWSDTVSNNPWVAIDLGKRTLVSHIKVSIPDNSIGHVPGSADLSGSNDGENWTLIKNIEFDPSLKTIKSEEIDLGRVYNYRHYKMSNFFVTMGNDHIVLSELELSYESDYLTKVPLSIHKTLSENVPDYLDDVANEIHLTEKGEIFAYDIDGKRIKLGGSSLTITNIEW